MTIFSIIMCIGLVAAIILGFISILSTDKSNKGNAIVGLMKILYFLGIGFIVYFAINIIK